MPEWLTLIIGIAVVPVVSWVLMSFAKDETIYNFFFSLGQKVDSGASKYIGDKNWEQLEDSITQKFVVMAQGLKDGADFDDNKVST